MPDLPIAVATDHPLVAGPFDQQVALAEPNGYRAKIAAAQRSPFNRTLQLDVDTYILADLGEVFRVLDRFDMALVHAPVGISMAFDDVPRSFPEFNTGVIAYRATQLVQDVLAEWLREYDTLASPFDQPSFRRVTYRAAGLRIATLPSEYNQRMVAGFFNQPVQILHGWPDRLAGERDYWRAAAAMTRPLESGAPCGVFAGRRVYNHEGKRVSGFAVPWRVPRAVVRRARRFMARAIPAR
jgi:hypothetical protein